MKLLNLIITVSCVFFLSACTVRESDETIKPNILFIITDDQSWEHAGCYGDKALRTPSIDRLANEGVRFENAYCAAPSCSPSRAGIFTGQDAFRLEEGGILTGILWEKFIVFPELLGDNGYHIGATGKRYWPRTQNVEGAIDEPIAKIYDRQRHDSTPDFISNNDYSANFEEFLDDNSEGKPFFFWVGTGEPHRKYEIDRGIRTGIDTSEIRIPAFFPDVPEAKLDMADYMAEIEWVDNAVREMIDILVSKDLLDNTLIIYTSDNGMPFPRAKATLYDHGVRMPLIMRWGNEIKKGRVVTDPVSLTDMAPTFLELAGVEIPEEMTGRSITNMLFSSESGDIDPDRDFVVTTFEKHTLCRPDSMGFPRRAIHTEEWTYIINYQPDLYPMGNADLFIPNWDVLGDTDPGRLKEYFKQNMDNQDFRNYWDLAFGKVPSEQLFNKKNDPDMINNLADDPAYNEIKTDMKTKLENYLKEHNDPRSKGESPWDNFNLDKS